MSHQPIQVTQLLDELDALAKQLDPKAGEQTMKALARELEDARRALAATEGAATAVGMSRLFDVAHQRLASVLRTYDLSHEDRVALESSAADLQEWRMELLQQER